MDVSIDRRLTTVPQLLETGLLMPARIPRIGFGDKSQSLYEGVKLLTGLDQLGDIADGVSKFETRLSAFTNMPRIKASKLSKAPLLRISKID